MATLFHLCAATDWQEARHRGEYRAESLETAGFIHLSTRVQVVKTADRFYRGRGGLVLLVLSDALLLAPVRYEAADGDLFPHVYGPINLDAVMAVLPFAPADDGTFHLPAGADADTAGPEGSECSH